ncbi:ComF family protein [Magnetospirillum sulfuroxidans]|uniref:ComF family protein n=1 Tax=Magnetospirillum sulfuroxidans TaxID=611300 RepID=A0ABS5IHD0_9PROT|nr:ComF family protein [Magnetospirillum sulfuroxidans]MBR9973602.1 ComF family protein [Magnetospirillum sulfuroxidans]
MWQVSHWFRTALDAVLPPLCLCCGAQVAEPGALCGRCWGSLRFVSAPFCQACGHPFDVDPGGAECLCGRCMAEPPAWRRARAVFCYDDASKPLLLRFKHGDRLEGAPAFGRWMARAGAELLVESDLIVPVPLHRWRLLARRYNQAALLALAVGREAGRPVAADGLRRLRRTPPQGHFSREERRKNVKGAFAVKPGLDVTGQKIVLIDDVLTTGATLGECARLLLKNGAATVDVLILGRVVLSQP